MMIARSRVEILIFFRLLYTIAKMASINASIIALLDFISAVQYMIHASLLNQICLVWGLACSKY